MGLPSSKPSAKPASSTRNPVLLTEFVRQSIRRTLVKPFLNASREMPAHFLDAGLERSIETAVEHGEQTSHLNASPEVIRQITQAVERTISRPEGPHRPDYRLGLPLLHPPDFGACCANLFVLAHNEIPPEQKVISLGTIK